MPVCNVCLCVGVCDSYISWYAFQIYHEARKFGKAYDLHALCVYGGGSKWEQSNAVKEGCEILVATPVSEGGRVVREGEVATPVSEGGRVVREGEVATPVSEGGRVVREGRGHTCEGGGY